MLRPRRRPPQLFTDFNTLAFACVTSMVLFVLVLAFMTQAAPHHGWVSADLPKVLHPVSIPGAVREDAIRITIQRDGNVYIGNDRVTQAQLPVKIRERLQDLAVERKVYVVADFRARWGSVKSVLEGIRSAGILRVTFLVNERKIMRLPGHIAY